MPCSWYSDSSPLTRGRLARAASRGCCVAARLIPTHAGKTASAPADRADQQAHPRSRGEQADSVERKAREGLIPAHARKTNSPRTGLRWESAHPRSRGENVREGAVGAPVGGSSPPTRGKLLVHVERRLIHRLIPAHAGKTSRPDPPRTSRPAHPRSRGENDSQAGSWQPWWGSSPLTRGKRARRSGGRTRWRLIPSHAGKTTHSVKETPAHRVHPRSHGENGSSICWKPYHVGSSPLTQGKHHDPDHQSAGTVLPRSHGENKQLLVAAASQRGSSPPTRGKHQADRPRRRKDGLIPAHAGKTRFCLVCPRRPRAHPRSHRENRSDMQEFLNALGSSPLMRGKRPAVDERSRSNGLIPAHARITSSSSPPGVKARAHPHSHRENVMILTTSRPVPFFPAHAGKTATSPPSPSCGPAHPRSRGENQCRSLIFCARSGSSPLTRGKPY